MAFRFVMRIARYVSGLGSGQAPANCVTVPPAQRSTSARRPGPSRLGGAIERRDDLSDPIGLSMFTSGYRPVANDLTVGDPHQLGPSFNHHIGRGACAGVLRVEAANVDCQHICRQRRSAGPNDPHSRGPRLQLLNCHTVEHLLRWRGPARGGDVSNLIAGGRQNPVALALPIERRACVEDDHRNRAVRGSTERQPMSSSAGTRSRACSSRPSARSPRRIVPPRCKLQRAAAPREICRVSLRNLHFLGAAAGQERLRVLLES